MKPPLSPSGPSALAAAGMVAPVPTVTAALAPKPPRRPRYSGKNPRRFEEKYKEHNPTKYAADVLKVLASGKTPAGTHRPIMVGEILARMAPQSGETMVDATLGYGGHSVELLRCLAPGGRLLGLDVDPLEQPKTEVRLRAMGHDANALVVRLGNFAGVGRALAELGWDRVDGVLADLGVSSMQLDDPARGFTFKLDGPLDLRLNPHRGISASTWLARVSVDKLARTLSENADEPHAEMLARELVAAGTVAPFTRTVPLADAIRRCVMNGAGERAKTDADAVVRRVFQALRIAVNEELSALDALLRSLPSVLKPGGRVAILTFHSGEDRRVKQAFKSGFRAGVWSAVAEEVERPTDEEVRSNPRASAAKLRWAIRA